MVLASLIAALSIYTHGMAQRNADELLKAVIDKTNDYETLEVEFTYTMVNSQAGINEVKEGKVFVKGDAYKLLIAGQTVISDGKTVWTYLEESREVMISDVDEGDDAITPGNLLTSYYTDFDASFVNVQANASRGLKTIELKPQSRRGLNKMQIAVKEADLSIDSFSVIDNGGSTFTYNIRKLNPNVSIAAGMFTFNPSDYPDLEDIIDMR